MQVFGVNRAGAEIDLALLRRGRTHTAERKRASAGQALNEPPHAVVADAALVAAQVLARPWLKSGSLMYIAVRGVRTRRLRMATGGRLPRR